MSVILLQGASKFFDLRKNRLFCNSFFCVPLLKAEETITHAIFKWVCDYAATYFFFLYFLSSHL